MKIKLLITAVAIALASPAMAGGSVHWNVGVAVGVPVYGGYYPGYGAGGYYGYSGYPGYGYGSYYNPYSYPRYTAYPVVVPQPVYIQQPPAYHPPRVIQGGTAVQSLNMPNNFVWTYDKNCDCYTGKYIK